MMRKVICVVLAITMLFGFSVASSAAEQVLEWTNIADVTGGEISFNNTDGRYYIYILGDTNVERISATVTLYYWNTRGNRWVELYTDWWYMVESNCLAINESFTGTSGRQYKAVLEATVTMDGYDESYSQTSIVTCP